MKGVNVNIESGESLNSSSSSNSKGSGTNNNLYLVESLVESLSSFEDELVVSGERSGGGSSKAEAETRGIRSSSRRSCSKRRKLVVERIMPDGVRNGISSSDNKKTLLAESEFGMGGGGEDEEDDNDDRIWKKSFNHAFVFDLFRAAVDGKMLNGSRKWSSTGPRDADYVMLVLNQKLKENEELMMLLDRLKSMGVPCIFFSSSDLRTPPQNGTVKSINNSSVLLEPGTQHNGMISSSPSQPAKILKNGPASLVSSSVKTPEVPLPEELQLSPEPPVDLNNHFEDFDDLPSISSPATPAEKDSEPNSPNVTAETSLETSSSCPAKASRTKRKRRRKHPYLTRKSVKRKIPEVLKETESRSPLKIEIPSISPSAAIEDPYAFTPEDEDDDEDLSLDLLHSPKRRKKNGLPKEASLNRAKAAVIARVFGDISCSLSPAKDNSPTSSGVRSGSPDNLIAKGLKKLPQPPTKAKRRRKKPMTGRKRKAKVTKIKVQVQKTKSCVQEKEEESLLMISKEDASEVGEKKSDSTTLDINEEDVTKKEEGADLLDPSEPAKEEPESNSGLPDEKNSHKVESKINGALPDFLSLFNLKPKNDASSSVPAEPDEATSPLSTSHSSPSTATESTKCSTLLEPTSKEEAHQVISPKEVPTGTPPASDSTSELKLTGVELPPEIMMPPPPPPPPVSKDLQAETAGPSSDQMTLRRPSFYALIAGNVRNNMENFLDGKMPDAKDAKPNRRRKRPKNGFLLHHGDNFPEDPEAPYKLHLATQILLKLNKRRAKFKPKEDKGKSLLSYLKLVPKRVSRGGKGSSSNLSVAASEETQSNSGGDSSETAQEPYSVFSGEWVQERNFICNVCGHVESYFWDMVMHKGEIHPGVVVTHVELPDMPPEGFRVPPPVPDTSVLPTTPPACTKCQATFNTYPDLHRHIFECAGNLAWLEEPKPPRKKKTSRKKGFKRRFSNSPRKKPSESVRKVRATSEVFKCEFCTREFKTEGWLKNHVVSHSLPISIPLAKLNLPPSSSTTLSSRRSTIASLIAASKSNSS